MNILVVGNGGREHALVWKIGQSPRADRVFVATGNAGTDTDGENIAIQPSDFPALIRFAKENEVGLTVVGPESHLAAGIVDAFEEAGLRAFGPQPRRRRTRGQQGLLQGPAPPRRRAHRRLSDVCQPRRRRQVPQGPRGRARGGQGGRAGRRKGRRRLRQPRRGPAGGRADRAAKGRSAPPATVW